MSLRARFFFTAAAALAISIDSSAMTTSAIDDDDFFCIHCDFFFMSCLRFHFHNWHLLLQIGFGWSQPEANLYMPLLFRQTYRRKMLSGTFRVLWIFMPKMTPFLIKNLSEARKSLKNINCSTRVSKVIKCTPIQLWTSKLHILIFFCFLGIHPRSLSRGSINGVRPRHRLRSMQLWF